MSKHRCTCKSYEDDSEQYSDCEYSDESSYKKSRKACNCKRCVSYVCDCRRCYRRPDDRECLKERDRKKDKDKDRDRERDKDKERDRERDKDKDNKNKYKKTCDKECSNKPPETPVPIEPKDIRCKKDGQCIVITIN